MPEKKQDTEQKIKEAARKIFQAKGFSATKTRDISEAANINLALLNYYFRSKKKLFDIIMIETMQAFFSGLISILNNKETSFHEKINSVVDYYIELLSENPNVATFIINTVRENPSDFISKIGLLDKAKKSIFIAQFQEYFKKGKLPPIHPLHFLLNLMGMVVFPFVAQPMIQSATGISQHSYHKLMLERKKLIPIWIESMLIVK